ncbi:glycosyltransferase family 4 protein [Faecalibaculum rodentium]|uniref:glycosyltransferase family 4 protein n=1 Tax=Faecalibaculum rodentium TaxID=1702221 RepID=UPI0023F346AB|nr:glycosyltransferase family 4 protein [Faecalibaculum rodentium]
MMADNRLKLLVTASTFPRGEHDTEPRFVLDLCKCLNKNYKVSVLVPAYPGCKDLEHIEGIEVIRYHYLPFNKLETLCYPGAIVPRIKEKKIRSLQVPFLFLGLAWKLFKIQTNYDVIHSHWLIPQGIVQSFFQHPFILTCHGGDIKALNFSVIKKLKYYALKHASQITFVSKDLMQFTEEHICKDKSIEYKSSVIPMGVDTTRFSPSFRINDYFTNDSKKTVLFVGRFAEKKGISYLIESMKNVPAHLVLVGTGPLDMQLKREASSAGISCQFMGAKSHEELSKIYASADVLCVPSITASNGDTEGMPTVIAEGMASGLPVVATRHGGIPAIVQDGVNGFLVPEKSSEQLADKLNKLLSDKTLYTLFREKAIQTAEEFSYDELAKKYREVIDKALSESR